MGAESTWYGGRGCAANVDQASEDEGSCGSTMRRSRQVSNHDNRTLAPRRRSSCSDPVQSHQAAAHLLGAQSQNQAQDWRCWRGVQRRVGGMGGDTCQRSSFHSCNTFEPLFDTSRKDFEGNRWTLKAGGVEIDDWGLWQAFRASIEVQLSRAGQISPRCSSTISSRRKKVPACSPRNASGSGYSIVLDAGATLSCRAGGDAALSAMRGRGRGHASSSLTMQSQHT